MSVGSQINDELTTFDLILRQVRPLGGLATDLAVRDGHWAAIGPIAGHAAVEIDCHGLTALPGLVDGHMHLDKTLLGESWHPHLPITTLMVGEEHGGGGTVFTTLAVGEEGTATTVYGEDAGALTQSPTTTATGEEGGGGPITTAVGEAGGVLTTEAIGEEGPIVTTVVGEHSYISVTTYVVGEEGPIVTTVVGEHHHVPVITTVAGEEPQGGGGGAGPFGSF